jgi:hypothetical protein
MASTFRSNAMSAQGSAVYVAKVVAAGGADDITITGITSASPAVITGANDLLSGDVGKFSGVVGMTQINEQESATSGATATTFEAHNIDASDYTAYGSAGVFTPYEMLKACEARDFNIAGGQKAEIAVTTLCSTAVETRLGLPDYGEATMNVNFVPGDPAQVELEAANTDGLARWFKVVLPNGCAVLSFQAFVRQISLSIGVNQALQGTIGLRITGPVDQLDVIPPPTALAA